jgi:hypothetical protein
MAFFKHLSTGQLEELKCRPILFSDIRDSSEAVDVVDEVEHLLVGLIVVERHDWNAVVDVECEGIHRVIHYHDIAKLELLFLENAQVFHIVAIGGEHAVLPVQPGFKQLSLRVNIVEYGICIYLVTGCKYYYLKIFRCFLDAFYNVGSDVNSSVDGVLIRKINFNENITGLLFDIVDAVDQSLIHVKNEQFLFV